MTFCTREQGTRSDSLIHWKASLYNFIFNKFSTLVTSPLLIDPKVQDFEYHFTLLLLLFSCKVVSDFFVAPWTIAHQAPLSMEFSSKNTTVGCYSLLWGIFLTQGSNLCLLHRQVDLYHEPPYLLCMTLNERVNGWVNCNSCLMTVKMVVNVSTKNFIGSRIYGNMCCNRLGLILQATEKY